MVESINDIVMKVDAVKYSEIPSHTKLYNVNEIEYFLWVKLPDVLSRSIQLLDMFEIQPEVKNYNLISTVERECNRPWLRIQTNTLNMVEGLHIYRLNVIDKYTNECVSLYFGYRIQDDNPRKPYIYMKRKNELCQ